MASSRIILGKAAFSIVTLPTVDASRSDTWESNQTYYSMIQLAIIVSANAHLMYRVGRKQPHISSGDLIAISPHLGPPPHPIGA